MKQVMHLKINQSRLASILKMKTKKCYLEKLTTHFVEPFGVRAISQMSVHHSTPRGLFC